MGVFNFVLKWHLQRFNSLTQFMSWPSPHLLKEIPLNKLWNLSKIYSIQFTYKMDGHVYISLSQYTFLPNISEKEVRYFILPIYYHVHLLWHKDKWHPQKRKNMNLRIHFMWFFGYQKTGAFFFGIWKFKLTHQCAFLKQIKLMNRNAFFKAKSNFTVKSNWRMEPKFLRQKIESKILRQKFKGHVCVMNLSN